jgi:hypothetical protein
MPIKTEGIRGAHLRFTAPWQGGCSRLRAGAKTPHCPPQDDGLVPNHPRWRLIIYRSASILMSVTTPPP